MKVEKILVPLDGSTLAEAAMWKAAEMANGGTVSLLRAAEAHTLPGADPVDAQVTAVREAEEYLASALKRLEQQGDQFQYGGPQLCWDWRFPTPDGKAHFTPVEPPKHDWPAGAFMVSTRRGKQFNSMVHESRDLLTGAGRETVLISPADADRLGLQDGDRIRLSNSVGSFSGRAQIAPVQPGNLQLHWPEGNVLIGRHTRSPKSGIPDYNAAAWLEKLEVRDAASPRE